MRERYLHPSITPERVEAACDQRKGFCIYCGADHDDVEPDDHRERCDICEERGVCGAESLLIYMPPERKRDA